MTDPFGRAADLQRVPRGDVLGTYDSYPDAQGVVDRLAKADYPIASVSIVGNDLKTVERVTRKLSWSRAAIEGAVSGAWFGLFIGLLFTLFPSQNGVQWGLFFAAILIGAAAGLLFRLAGYGFSRRNRDFDSTRQMLAANYQVIVPDGQLAAAQDALARGPRD